MRTCVNYQDIGDTKQRIKFTQTECDNESQISDAIRNSQDKLDQCSNSTPSGYDRIEEQTITNVYYMPRNKHYYSTYDNSDIKETAQNTINKRIISNNKFKSKNSNKYRNYYYGNEQCLCDPKYDQRYDIYSEYGFKSSLSKKNKSPYRNNSPSSLNTIKNFNHIAKNIGYYETKDLSRSPSPSPSYSNKYRNINNKYITSNEYKSYNINKVKNNNLRDVRKRLCNNSNYNTINNLRDIRKKLCNNSNYKKNNTYIKKYFYNSNKKNNKSFDPIVINSHEEYNYKESYPNRYMNYTPIEGGRIENYFENEITEDGKYLVTMSLAKKVMDENDGSSVRTEETKAITKKALDENESGLDGSECKKNNYYSKEVEIDERNGGQKDIEEKYTTLRVRNKDYGDNYRYFERNENRSPLKTITLQRRRGPIHVYGYETYETNDVVRRYRVNLPGKHQKKIIRTYTKENENYNDENDNDCEEYYYDFTDTGNDCNKNENIIKTKTQSMQFPSEYKNGEDYYFY